MATTNSYYPTRIGDQIIWLRNARNKIANYKVALGYTDPEIAAFQADCDRLIYLLETVQTAAQQFAQAVTAHLNLLRTGTGAVVVDLPAFTLPAAPVPPANVLPGALKRVTSFITNLKTRTGYVSTTGEDLGVIGATPTAPDPATTKALIKAVMAAGGNVEVQWKKLSFSGVKIQVDRGTGGWVDLATDTEPHYIDTFRLPAGTAAVWKYRAIYLLGDEPFGQWSDPVSIAVQG